MEVTCLCPTYGRFSLVQRAIACFVRQRHVPRTLLIWNDAPRELVLGDFEMPEGAQVVIVNEPLEEERLGAKRNRMLASVETELAAHWDDDNLYLPRHLDKAVKRLRKRAAWAVAAIPLCCYDGPGEFHLKLRPKMGTFVFRTALAKAGPGYREGRSTWGECAGWRKPWVDGTRLKAFFTPRATAIWDRRDVWLHAGRYMTAGRHHIGNRDFGEPGAKLTPDFEAVDTVVEDLKTWRAELSHTQ